MATRRNVTMTTMTANGPSTTRVLLVDSWPILLNALTLLLDQYRPRLQVVGQASSLARAVELARHSRPDVILLSMWRDGIGLPGTLTALRRYGRVIVLRGMHEQLPVSAVLELGAAGVVSAEQPAEVIVHAILKAGELPPYGTAWLPSAPGVNLVQESQRGSYAKRRSTLTARERELIGALVANPGAKYLVIAAQLGISEHTVHNHLSNIYQKLNVVNRNDLLVWAVRNGLGAEEDSDQPRLSASVAPVRVHQG